METVAQQRFRGKIDYLLQHIEIVDLSLQLLDKNISEVEKSNPNRFHQSKILDLLPEADKIYDYKRLDNLSMKQWPVTFYKYSKKLNAEYSLHLLYSYFEEYVDHIVQNLEMNIKDIAKVDILEDIEISVSSLIENCGSLDDITKMLSLSLQDYIEGRKSCRKKLDCLEKFYNLQNFGRVKADALYVLDIRNAMVHDGGQITQKLKDRWKRKVPEDVGQKIKIDLPFIYSSINNLKMFVEMFDKEAIDKKIVPTRFELV